MTDTEQSRPDRRREWTTTFIVTFVVVVVCYFVVSAFFQDRIVAARASFQTWTDAVTWSWSWSGSADSVAIPLPRPEVFVVTRSLFDAPEEPVSRLSGAVLLSPPYTVPRSDIIRQGSTEVRLAFVEGLEPGAICLDRFLMKTSCGLMGRASLQNLIAPSNLRCLPVFYRETDTRYQCYLDNVDLAEHQVRAGFARPDIHGTATLLSAMRGARNAEAGAWNGGWHIVSPLDLRRAGMLLEGLDSLRKERAEEGEQ